METQVMTALPTQFYAIAGFIAVTQFGVLITLITFVFKSGMFVAKTEGGIAEAKKDAADARDVGIRAHKRVDKLADKFGEVI